MDRSVHFWVALTYLLIAGIFGYQTFRHTETAVHVLSKVFEIDNWKYIFAEEEPNLIGKIIQGHHLIGPLIAPQVKNFINQTFDLPSLTKVKQDTDKIPGLKIQIEKEGKKSSLWSWILIAISFIYFILVMAFFKKSRIKNILYSLTNISIVSFVVGITTPALMIVAMSPKTQYLPSAVLHYEIRSVLGVISKLFSSGHWFVASALTLFSILIPISKAILTLYATEFASLSAKLTIAKFLHLIGKWSMADVFVAALLLVSFAIKADQTTQAYLFRGFYYFLAYCLLSMVSTTLLEYQVNKIDQTLIVQQG